MQDVNSALLVRDCHILICQRQIPLVLRLRLAMTIILILSLSYQADFVYFLLDKKVTKLISSLLHRSAFLRQAWNCALLMQ